MSKLTQQALESAIKLKAKLEAIGGKRTDEQNEQLKKVNEMLQKHKDAEAAEASAAETKPAETKPAETKPAETKPAETDIPAYEVPEGEEDMYHVKVESHKRANLEKNSFEAVESILKYNSKADYDNFVKFSGSLGYSIIALLHEPK